ncbi:Transcription factor bHLH49 [Hordeum vulgare]|uniref:Predicted protein n=1 Tax=Hordeum vulgare subsp. vulgare TaxID=112509 RepID=F2DYY7_HORVV|nr:Transcription factor bHLH49 [Hordeum vulgare]BAK00309.1 predicted protein [Hordeum vulgare subsp. vulgare]
METNEKNAAELEEKNQPSGHDQQPSFHGPGFSLSPEAQMDSSTSALAAMGNPFPPGLWNPPGQNFGLGEANTNAMLNGHQFSSFLGMLSAATPAYPGAPSGFMDCGTGFPGLSANSLGAMMDHPFSRNPPMGSFQNDIETSREMNVDEGCKDALLTGDKQQGDTESSHGVDASSKELSKPECSGGAGQDEGPSVSCPKKRKRPSQDRGVKNVQEGSQQLATLAAKQEKDDGDKDEPKRPIVTSRKSNGKQTEDKSDAPKEDYIHIRARSGQATNSHSLAERVRREKISERMKFLQDLVPGCSKVIGKAVMLDEIINYVQSLQRQVEFLSMKLSAVNPALDFNIERILSKDLFQSQGTASSTFGFLPDIGHQFLHPPKHSQAALHSIVNPADAFGRVTNAPVGCTFKEATHQVPNNFDGEFHNVIGMPFTLFNDQESNGKP